MVGNNMNTKNVPSEIEVHKAGKGLYKLYYKARYAGCAYKSQTTKGWVIEGLHGDVLEFDRDAVAQLAQQGVKHDKHMWSAIVATLPALKEVH